MTFDPMSVEVTCVTLPKDHCVQVPWQYINVCGYSDQFCKIPHTYTYTYIHTYILHTTYRMSDHIVSYWTQFRRDKNWLIYFQMNWYVFKFLTSYPMGIELRTCSILSENSPVHNTPTIMLVLCTMWEERFSDLSSVSPMAPNPCEELPAGAQCLWAEWKCLNRLKIDWHRPLQGTPPQTGILEWQPRSKPWMQLHIMQHLLQCPLLEQECTAEDC